VRYRDPCGQGAVEYVALLLVAGAVLALSAVALPAGITERVAAAVRTGLCTVGGDVCRGSEAAAAGLAPCVTSARSERQDTTADIAVVRLGGHGEWQLALRSDGQAVVTRLAQGDVGGTIGVGLTFSPASIGAEAEVALVAEYRDGQAWRFADARRAREFLRAAMRDASVREAREPDVRWRAAGAGAGAAALAGIAELVRAGVDASTEAAIGLRSDGDRRTLTFDLQVDDPHFAADLPGSPAAAGTQRSWTADVTWERGAARELVLRTATGGGGRVEEYSAALDLRDPANLAVARRLLAPGRSTPADLRALVERIRTAGAIERDGYAVSERRRGFSVGARLGVGFGLEHRRISAERRLVDAVTWIRGGPPRRRFDCLGA